jgi:predicted  nucleic acid-binding Zn-ribbon protein
MAQKMLQTGPNASGYVEDYGAASTTPAPTTSVWARSPEDDDDYATAKAAAEEAKAKLAAGRPPTDGLMGRLFYRKGQRGPGSTSNSVPGSSQHSTHFIETPVERMQREQEEIKRAVAERQLAMQQEEVPSPRQAKPESPEPIEQPETPTWGTSISRSTSWSRPTVPVSPPTPPKTPAKKLDDMICSFEEKVQKAMDRVAQMRDQHKGLLDERLVSLAKERLATQSMVAAEAQQMAAAEAEDYDLADRLAAVIDQYAREKAELHSILDNIGRALAELDSQKQQVVGEVAACFARVKDELQTFYEEQESSDKKDDTEVRCFV